MRTRLLLLLCAPGLLFGNPLERAQPFLEHHCYDCHGSEKQKGDLRFDTLGNDLTEIENLEIWQGILDQLNLGEMPPRKAPQPKQKEVIPIVNLLSGELTKAYEQARSTGGQTILRRLNRHELRNTLRDLLYLNGAHYRPDAAGSRLIDNNGNGSVERTGRDPLRFFPEDEAEDGFFNIGDNLVMSDFLLKLTLNAVEETLAEATHLEPRPDVETRRFAGHLIKGRGGHLIETASRELNPDFDLIMTGYEVQGRLSPTDLRGGVGVGARYRITVEASAHNKDQHPWEEMTKLEDKDPFQLCLNIADTKNGGLAGITSTPLALWSVPPDGKAHTFSHEVWIDETWTPWIGWENGPNSRPFRVEGILKKFHPELLTERPDKKIDKEAHESWPLDMAKKLLVNSRYPGPHLRVHSLTLEPLINTWPPQSHTNLYGKGTGTEAEIRRLMKSFATRAFRRPISNAEIEPFVQLVLRQQVDPVVEMEGGIQDLTYRVYDGKWGKLPEFDQLNPIAQGKLPRGYLDLKVAQRKEYYGIVFEGKINAPTAGEYTLEMASDDGARILINGNKVVEHDGLHGQELRKGKVTLKKGPHDIRVEYLAFGQPNGFRAGWTEPGSNHARLSVDSLRQQNNQKQKKDSLPPLIRAMQDGYASILCSPQFLYLKEKPGPLDDFAIASRLSYFLWSSMPDAKLFELARAGKLHEPAELDRQIERMLKDPKAAAFIRHFTSAWLRLDKLGKMPPSGGDYQFYKNLKVEPMLLKQVTTYFEDILTTNGRIAQFIDSDYTYMNQVLGKWIYRREDIRGARLRKVKLNDPRRGGIFTQPGIMTATANGVDTSPVIRGTWVLENVLGTPPQPPPPDIEPLPTDTRDAVTIRERLDLHRRNESCASCHAKIDPMGFAFENFDVVGRWRDRYRGVNEPIDTTSITTTGREIADIVDFKKMLKEREPRIVQCLTEKMLTHATGRRLEATDRGEINRIIRDLGKNQNRLRDLVHLVVKSDLFLNK
ncbi:MAG: DUF1592 domain-containing protein [Akkermansiaceae bacterium]|nr:DUF1592 domain-containing protein [Akkermansiaceae bacterium]